MMPACCPTQAFAMQQATGTALSRYLQQEANAHCSGLRTA
jgi:hypothetical protein